MENIKLKGAKNVRDLGGLRVKDGTVKSGMLLRASHLNRLTERDADLLVDTYGLRTVIDLRNTAEKAEKPNIRIPGVTQLEMPVFDASLPGMSHETRQALDKVPYLGDIYTAVMQGESVYNLAAVIRRIVRAEEGEYAFLYHCTEGKDRTGMVTALLLLLLGADRETIYEDYLYTNTVNKKKAVKYYWLVRLVKRNKPAAGLVRDVYLAKREYLDAVFDAIDNTYGGEERFIQNVLQLSKEDIQSFRERLIQK